MKKTPSIFIFTLLSTSILSACGGGGSNSTVHNDNNNQTPPVPSQPQTFQSHLISSLTIEEKTNTGASILYTIKDRTTTEKDKIIAYSVLTEIGNTLQAYGINPTTINYPQLTQTFHFELQENLFRLEVHYDPIRKKVDSFTLIQRISDQIEQEFRCRPADPNVLCTGTELNYDPKTGTLDLSFNQSTFKSNDPDLSLFTLTGKLKGTLSTPPKTVQNIPKISQGSVTIDGKVHQILTAVNTSEKIIGSRFFPANISILLDNATNLSFSKYQHGVFSRLIDFEKEGQNAFLSNENNLIIKDLKTADQVTLSPSTFDFVNFINDDPLFKPLIINAHVEVPRPKQILSFSPKASSSPKKDKDNPWYSQSALNYSFTPEDFTVRIINHNTVTLESQGITATIQDKKLKSLKLSDFIFNLDDSSSMTQLIQLDYQCGDTAPACTGVTIETNGFGVKFNNTMLTNMQANNSNDEYSQPPAITLNGGLVYLGR